MTTKIINGKIIADKILAQIKTDVARLKKRGITPKLGVILVGNDKPSLTYVRKKEEATHTAGMEFILKKYSASISKNNLIAEIKKMQQTEKLTGLILQLPVPEKLYCPDVLNSISTTIDVDCLTEENIGKLVMKTNWFLPPTPNAVIKVLDEIGVNVVGKDITIVGTGALVGKPLSIILMNMGACVTTCNSRTLNIKEKTKKADIVVTGVGKKDLLRGNMIKKGAIVVDTGIVFENGKMYGDVNREEIIKKASYFTPTPGGIGPITVSLLLQNTILCARKNSKV